jgi:hypothetical protein
MPRLSPDEMRRLIRECLEAEAHHVELPDDVEGRFTARVQPAADGPSYDFNLAVRTITRDTRHAGVWVHRLKIQATGLEGVRHLDALLGINVFGGEPVVTSFDVARHIPVTGESNNIQFPEAMIYEARDVGRIVEHVKDNGEPVAAVPGMLLTPFLLGLLPTAPLSPDPGAVVPPPVSFRTYRARVRSPKFADSVLRLHQNRCAACGVGLDIVEAAHIVPHALTGDDAVENGICLCPNHHTAFDLIDLVAFSPDRRIWVNAAKLKVLERAGDQTHGMVIVLSYLWPTLSAVAVDQAARLEHRFARQTEDPEEWQPRSEMKF